jgi:hypothetical protein
VTENPLFKLCHENPKTDEQYYEASNYNEPFSFTPIKPVYMTEFIKEQSTTDYCQNNAQIQRSQNPTQRILFTHLHNKMFGAHVPFLARGEWG